MQFKLDKALCDLNTYINKERANKFNGARIKKQETEFVMLFTKRLAPVTEYPVDVYIEWHQNGRKDPDNIAFGIKFILDGLVKNGIIQNDGQKQIRSIHHTFIKDTADFCIVKLAN